MSYLSGVIQKKYEEQGSYLDFVTARQQGKEENTKFLIEKKAFECIEAGSGKVLGGNGI